MVRFFIRSLFYSLMKEIELFEKNFEFNLFDYILRKYDQKKTNKIIIIIIF